MQSKLLAVAAALVVCAAVEIVTMAPASAGYGTHVDRDSSAYDRGYFYDPGYVPRPGYAYVPEYDYGTAPGGDNAYCAQRFRSYDPASGTYLGYDGLRHPCP